MAGDGLYWYTDPGVYGQKFTAHSKRMGPLAAGIVQRATKEAVDYMREAVMTRGVEWGQPTGGPRAKTFAMYDSIGSSVSSAGLKTKADWGFINNPPFYTKFQEPGTSRTGWGGPIAPMHAFADAQVKFVDAMEDEFQSVNLWENF